MMQKYERWGLEWFSETKLDGTTHHLIFENCRPVFFDSRHEARKYANEKYGYIKSRKDLRVEPHGWRMPKPVRITGIEYTRTK